MNVKIDTKEKFSVITPVEPEIAANMTEELRQILERQQNSSPGHLVLNMQHVNILDDAAADIIAGMQQRFYEHNLSFVVCELQAPLEKMLDERELLEVMNTTPTESEAWDIVQMEEIERELLGDDEMEG